MSGIKPNNTDAKCQLVHTNHAARRGRLVIILYLKMCFHSSDVFVVVVVVAAAVSVLILAVEVAADFQHVVDVFVVVVVMVDVLSSRHLMTISLIIIIIIL